MLMGHEGLVVVVDLGGFPLLQVGGPVFALGWREMKECY